MALIFGKIKCYFCNKKDGLLQSVCHCGLYGELGKRIFYHDECLQIVEVDPEKFSNIMVDKAIYINDLKKECMKRFNKYIIQKHRKKIEELNRSNFERMMPKV